MWVLWSWFYVKWIVIRLYLISYYYCYPHELNINFGGMIQEGYIFENMLSWCVFLNELGEDRD